MPDRVYMNRCTGEERIHIEITRDEISQMLARPAGPAARAFWGLVATADHQFNDVTLVNPIRSNAPDGSRPLTVGDVIHGFAYGAFGRDHYDCVRIEAVGPDWIIGRGAEQWHGPSFTSGQHALQLCQQARDEACPVDSPCPLGVPAPPLTTYGVTQ